MIKHLLARIDIPVKEYMMTDEDLIAYNIKNTDDYKIFKLINVDTSKIII